jgi:hypothetical protein
MTHAYPPAAHPSHPYAPPPVPPASGKATASMILGILGATVGWCALGIPSILAVVLGHVAMSETRQGVKSGRGMAIAGLVLGYVFVIPVISISIILIVSWLGHSVGESFDAPTN